MLDTPNERRRRNRYIFAGLIGMVVAMNGLAFAMVPAYRAFCQQFGFAGTPLVKETLPEASAAVDRPITVRFDSNIDPSLHWRFKPLQRSVELKVGESGLAFFEAENHEDRPVTGTATFNVTPLKAAPYFVKIECFCFTEQTLDPGQSVQIPVTFFVDPDFAEDRHMEDVTTITLSYTFFHDQDADVAPEAAAVQTITNTQVN